ncbi:glycosyl transferase [Metschnikowia bicuspidata var. bicuspidata NRRL YB-4993]|uniref:Alpha-1,4 glucan phosphorylase n=1 Tax=Metschnikowia bicuspidata var. bicuspidata NRRL YB-4993 TaxID=869754 RepID=A0A1A0H984_9ASCO|nr:glycosyl transferase [Metschnikowia bicuspidata var. bicuspidata NRRL YB-4993]OBA20679.1 glycosyl transferase [Metschnikowia bicuspidata var. bicuspidata NRRL YB-4993]
MGDYLTPSELPQPRLRRTNTGFTPNQIVAYDAQISEAAKIIWRKYSSLRPMGSTKERKKAEITAEEFENRFIKHVEFTLARNMYNCNDLGAYQAASQSIRDSVLLDWADTQQNQTVHDGKRVYYLSLEFLMGRAMDNALINTNSRAVVEKTLDNLGFCLEDILEQEPDAGLGNGGLGRLAACFVDSLSSKNYSGWGYGLNYQYGIFKQKIIDGYQVETPDYWLKYSNPWEIDRTEIQIPVDFYGAVEEVYDEKADKMKKVWKGGERVLAVAADFPIPGFNTSNTNNLRLWNARPTNEFDFNKFNAGDYQSSVAAQQRAESITAVLYPNDNFFHGKELRLKQQYFWVAASLHDIVRRFKKQHKDDWSKFTDKIAIQLNDTHPTLAIVELQRVLVDLEGLSWSDAWNIVTNTFAYTNHTVMTEALEKWPVELLGNLLPRHLQIIYDINYYFLKLVEAKFPNDMELLRRVSVIEENDCKSVRMAYLAIIGSHKVNGVAELHSELIRTTIFKDFVKIFGDEKFTNVTNGITPRRWLKQANPELASLIAEALNDPDYEYLTNLGKLKQLEKFVDDDKFLTRWDRIKFNNKRRLAELIKSETGIDVDPTVMFDIQVKRIHEYKRQQLNIFATIYRYLRIRELLAEGVSVDDIKLKHYISKASIFGGKAAPGYYMAKTIIHLINMAAEVINKDTEIDNLLKVVFIPDYNVSKAEIICPGSDLSNHISTAGTEASGTSNMKFALNGGLIIGTVDGANVEITREISEDNIFLFGNLAESVEEIRHKHLYHGVTVPKTLQKVFDAIESGMFGDPGEYKPLIESITNHGDYYLVTDDFDLMLECQEKLEKVYGHHGGDSSDPDHLHRWVKKSLLSVANMGFFSSDRCIDEYAENIWNVEPLSQ